MSTPEHTLDLVASLRATPRERRPRRVARLARPTLEALALVLLEQRARDGRDDQPAAAEEPR